MEAMAHRDMKIKCGEIVLIRNIWKLNYICEFCGKKLRKHKDFLRHVKDHVLDAAVLDEPGIAQDANCSDVEYSQLEEELNGEICLPQSSSCTMAALEESSVKKHGDMVTCVPGRIDTTDEECYPQEICFAEPLKNEGPERVLDLQQRVIDFAQLPFIQAKLSRGRTRRKMGDAYSLCDICGKTVKDKQNFTVHRNRHLNIKPYICKICGKATAQSGDLKRHMRSHTNEKKHTCDICGRAYSEVARLKVHIRSQHTNERPFKCSYCDKAFASSEHLRGHLPVHTIDRPFTCDLCSMSFPRRKALREHLKIHLNKKQYKCQFCSMEFNQYAGLYSHLKSHKHENSKG